MEFVGIVLVLTAVAVVVALVYRNVRENRRTQEFTQWAQARGWSYYATDTDQVRRFRGTPFTGGGKVRHVLSGPHRDWAAQSFEYFYTTTTGGNPPSTVTHVFQVTTVQLPAPTPELEVANEHLGHKLLSLVGVNDVRLGNPEFDDRFRVRADDEPFARNVLDHDAMRWLLDDPRAPQRPFRIEGQRILTWTKSSLTTAEALAQADFLVDVLQALPADAMRLPTDPPGPGAR